MEGAPLPPPPPPRAPASPHAHVAPETEALLAVAGANREFGRDGWSSSVEEFTKEFQHQQPDSRWTAGYSAVVRVSLRSGAFHEEVGFGAAEGAASELAAVEQAKKLAVASARTRALRLFTCRVDPSALAALDAAPVPRAEAQRSDSSPPQAGVASPPLPPSLPPSTPPVPPPPVNGLQPPALRSPAPAPHSASPRPLPASLAVRSAPPPKPRLPHRQQQAPAPLSPLRPPPTVLRLSAPPVDAPPEEPPALEVFPSAPLDDELALSEDVLQSLDNLEHAYNARSAQTRVREGAEALDESAAKKPRVVAAPVAGGSA